MILKNESDESSRYFHLGFLIDYILYLLNRPNVFLVFNKVVNCPSYDLDLLLSNLLFAFLDCKHLWVLLVLLDYIQCY